MGAYFYKMKMQVIVNLTYRFEVFASIGARMVLMVTMIFLWKLTFSQNSTIQDLSQAQMITYSVLAVCLSSAFQCGIQNTIRDGIRDGGIAVDLLRPYHPIVSYFAQDMGSVVTAVVNKALPLLILGQLFFGVTPPASVPAFLLFAGSSVLSLIILWLLSALVGMLSFWMMELGNMGVVKDTIVSILSGSMIPLWFFPEHVQKILYFLPFPYTYQTPIGLYIGKISILEGFVQMRIQLVWIAVLLLCTVLMWNRAKKNILIQGG